LLSERPKLVHVEGANPAKAIAARKRSKVARFENKKPTPRKTARGGSRFGTLGEIAPAMKKHAGIAIYAFNETSAAKVEPWNEQEARCRRRRREHHEALERYCESDEDSRLWKSVGQGADLLTGFHAMPRSKDLMQQSYESDSHRRVSVLGA